jgi:glutamate-ammonia-ligase adenylyltransferase
MTVAVTASQYKERRERWVSELITEVSAAQRLAPTGGDISAGGSSVGIECKYHQVQADRIIVGEYRSAAILLSYLQAGRCSAPPVKIPIMNSHQPLAQSEASRFVQRWLAADPVRAAELEAFTGLSLDQLDLADLLQKQLSKTPSLPAAMRRLRNLLVAAIATRDLGGYADLNEVLAAISRFADFVVNTHLDARYQEMCDLHGTPIGEESGRAQHMIVVGMGKLGGYELNVSSDIDLIFLYPEDGETVCTQEHQRPLSNHEFFVRLGRKLIGDIAEITEDGFSFRVDMALRPNGGSGPLAASFAMLETYLVTQGREWERYAWVKARALTGTTEDIGTLTQTVQPFVYRRYLDFGSIKALRTMHGQIRAEVVRQETRHPQRNVNVKLGRGGIREIEFLAQVFQLIRGGRDPSLRDRSTRTTLKTIAEKKLLTGDVVDRLLDSYRFLRNLEHRIQYLDDAQSHVLPPNDEDRLRIAQMMGYADVDALIHAHEECSQWVAAQFDAIFEDKSGQQAVDNNTAPQTPLDELDEETMATYLASLRFDEPTLAAQRLLSTLRSSRLQSLSEQRKTQLHALIRSALPMVLEEPGTRSVTLHRLLDLFEAIARRSAYLELLTEFPQALARVVRMIAASAWAAHYLNRHPVLMDELLDASALETEPDWSAFAAECRQRLLAFEGDTERQMDLLRELHHAVERLADHLSALADVLVAVTIEAVWQTLPGRHRDRPAFSVIAYGKLGGKELGYASDLDLIFLYDDDDQDAPSLYAKLAQRFITWMTSHTAAGVLFDIDVALRPDGASGLLVSSFTAFEKYQYQSAWVWEHQALTRARFCAGDSSIGERFETLRVALLRQSRDAVELRKEVLAMRKRMHDAHPNRSEDFDLKHDPGGMIDIEFIVQYLVLLHAHKHEELTADIGNIALLKLAGQIGLIDTRLATQVADAYREFRRLQHKIRLRGEDRARIEPTAIAAMRDAVIALWQIIFIH